MGHFDFSLFPVNLGVVVLKPVVAQDQTLFPKARDSQKHSLGVSFVVEKYIYDLGNLVCLVRGTVDIKDWDVMQEGLSVYPF